MAGQSEMPKLSLLEEAVQPMITERILAYHEELVKDSDWSA